MPWGFFNEEYNKFEKQTTNIDVAEKSFPKTCQVSKTWQV
jgi:hypothetical protein